MRWRNIALRFVVVCVASGTVTGCAPESTPAPEHEEAEVYRRPVAMEPTTVKDGRKGYSTTKNGIALTVYLEPTYRADEPEAQITIELSNGGKHTVFYEEQNFFDEFLIEIADPSGRRAKLRAGRTTYEPGQRGFRAINRELAVGDTRVCKVNLRKVFALEPGSYYLSAMMLMSYEQSESGFALPLQGIPLTVEAEAKADGKPLG